MRVIKEYESDELIAHWRYSHVMVSVTRWCTV